MKHLSSSHTAEDFEHFPLFDCFSFDIRPYTETVLFDSEEIMLEEGARSSRLYYLIDGRARLYITHANGRVTLVDFLDAPCFIGEMELLDPAKPSNGVTAVTPCTCYAIDTAACGEQILGDVKFLQHLCRFLSAKTNQNTINYSRNQAYPLDVRLARFILLTSYNGLYRERHTEVAEYLGVTYRHLLYVIAQFVKKGLLEKSVSGYRIKDTDALRRLANESE